jgi:hypothetical protein
MGQVYRPAESHASINRMLKKAASTEKAEVQAKVEA